MQLISNRKFISKFGAEKCCMKTIILNQMQIERIIKRIAYQIVEHAYEEATITMVGIKPRGVWVVKKLQEELNSLASFNIELCVVTAESQEDFDAIKNQVESRLVVLTDDILKSGETMMLAASRISLMNPKRLITACLVDRKHRRFPIHSDFTGLSLATTIQEHLTLDIDNGPVIYLD